MARQTFNIAKSFSRYPGGRDKSDGPFSGEDFRDLVLRPILDAGDQVELEMDGTRGYPPSFLEETFGGLVRKGYTKPQIIAGIIFTTTDEALKKEIIGYIDASAALSK